MSSPASACRTANSWRSSHISLPMAFMWIPNATCAKRESKMGENIRGPSGSGIQ